MHFNDCDMDLSRNDKITRKPHKPRGRVGGHIQRTFQSKVLGCLCRNSKKM